MLEMLREREQVDVRRQHMSIKESKERIKMHIGKINDFNSLYSSLEVEDKGMSV